MHEFSPRSGSANIPPTIRVTSARYPLIRLLAVGLTGIFAGMALMMGQRGLTFSVNRSAGNTVRLRSLSVHNIVGADAADRLSAL